MRTTPRVDTVSVFVYAQGMKSQAQKDRLVRRPGSDRLVDVAHETLRTFALTHNYNRWIVHLLTPYIGQRILEIGSGIGNLTLYLQDFGELTCIDISDLYLAHMRIDFPNVRFFRCDAAEDRLCDLRIERFDTIVCVNVLEHIKDDRKALANMHSILVTGGRLLLYVPALSGLYGSIDRNLDHFRRYDRRALDELLHVAGFEVERLHFSNLLGILGWFLNGKVQRKRELSNWQTILFDKFVPLLEKAEARIRPPFGMSLFAVARKTGA
jgi:SAM-dependent methyltransferase